MRPTRSARIRAEVQLATQAHYPLRYHLAGVYVEEVNDPDRLAGRRGAAVRQPVPGAGARLDRRGAAVADPTPTAPCACKSRECRRSSRKVACAIVVLVRAVVMPRLSWPASGWPWHFTVFEVGHCGVVGCGGVAGRLLHGAIDLTAHHWWRGLPARRGRGRARCECCAAAPAAGAAADTRRLPRAGSSVPRCRPVA
jgi:hypothetical protein